MHAFAGAFLRAMMTRRKARLIPLARTSLVCGMAASASLDKEASTILTMASM